MSQQTKLWLSRQPLYYGKDLGAAMLVAFIIGYVAGAVLFW